MRWRGRRESQHVEDRRGQRPRRVGLKLGGAALAVAVIAVLAGGDPAALLRLLGGSSSSTSDSAPADQQELVDFVSVVLADTEETWHGLSAQLGRSYEEPTLVLFSEAVESACGNASAAVGPFYCPGDRQLYIDLTFFAELERRFGAPGDFAQAYVVAHEVGHHVQTLLGTSQRVHAQQQGLGEAEANALSVRLELQADCFAGIWAHYADRARQLLEEGDIDEALNAASAIGDDTLQRRARGRVAPETFTHGSAAQRARWFRAGLDSGRLETCDTFATRSL